MSEITRGVLRMPPELWGDDPLSVAQRHARYVEAADTIDRLQAECDALRAAAQQVMERLALYHSANGFAADAEAIEAMLAALKEAP